MKTCAPDGAITFLFSGSARCSPKSGEATFAEDGPQHSGRSEGHWTRRPRSAGRQAAGRRRSRGSGSATAAPPMDSITTGGFGNRLRGIRSWAPASCRRHDPFIPRATRAVPPAQYFRDSISRGRRSGMRTDRRLDASGAQGFPATTVRIMRRSSSAMFSPKIVSSSQTWHRTAHIQGGRILKVVYGDSYPAYTRRRQVRASRSFIGRCWNSRVLGSPDARRCEITLHDRQLERHGTTPS